MAWALLSVAVFWAAVVTWEFVREVQEHDRTKRVLAIYQRRARGLGRQRQIAEVYFPKHESRN